MTLNSLGERKEDLISFVDAMLEIIKIYLAITDLYDDDEDLESTGKTLRRAQNWSNERTRHLRSRSVNVTVIIFAPHIVEFNTLRGGNSSVDTLLTSFYFLLLFSILFSFH